MIRRDGSRIGRLLLGGAASSSRLRRNFAASTAATVATFAITALSYPVYLATAGYQLFGAWLLVSTVFAVSQLSNLGVGPAVTYLVAQAHQRNAVGAVAALVRDALLFVTATSLAVAAGLVLFAADLVRTIGIDGALGAEARRVLPFVALLTICSLWVQILGAAISGLNRMDLSVAVDTASRFLTFGVTAALLWHRPGLSAFVIGASAGQACALAMYAWCVLRFVPLRVFVSAPFELKRRRGMLRMSSGMFGASVLVLLLNPFNRVLVSRVAGVVAVPVLEISVNAAMQFRSLFEAGFRSFAPEIGRTAGIPGQAAIERARTLCIRGRRLVLLTAPLWLTLCILADPAFALWLGKRFDPEIPNAFRVVAMGSYMSLLAVPSYYAFIGLGRTHHIFLHHLVQSVLNVLAGVGLALVLPSVTVLDVATVVAVSMLAASVYLWAQERRLLARCAPDFPTI